MPKLAEEKTSIKKRTTTKRMAAKRVVRKAPTRSSASSADSSTKTKFILMLLVGVFAVGGASVAIGMSDKGAINVTATISQRASVEEEKGNIEESEAIRAIGTQSKTINIPNGGLVGRGNKETEQQKLEAKADGEKDVAASTTTDETASSTEELNDTEEDGDDSDSSEENASSEEVDEPEGEAPVTE